MDNQKKEYILSELYPAYYLFMFKYYNFLKEKKIFLEEIFNYFFNQYIPEEFNLHFFNINITHDDLSYLNKLKILLPEMERILKQFKLFVEKKDNVEEILEISSKPFKYKEIPSLIDKKYAYFKNKKIKNEVRNKLRIIYENLIEKKLIKLDSDKKNLFNNLLKEDFVCLNQIGEICITKKGKFLCDLFENEFISYGNFYKKTFDEYKKIDKEYIENFEQENLYFGSTLLSEQECQVFNYFLNKSEYLSGNDIRNKYLHGTYSKDEKVHESDYITLLILFIVIIIKINEELCYYHKHY